MDFYPSEFSPEARDRIEREKIRAYREVLPNRAYSYNEQNLAIRCIMRIFQAFAKEACALRKERGWTIERIESKSKEFLQQLTILVVFDKFPGLDRYWISNMNGSIDSDVERRFKESAEWKEYEELLLATPELTPEEGIVDVEEKQLEASRTDGKQTESPGVQNNAKSTQDVKAEVTVQPQSAKGRRQRGPDYETSRQRVALEDSLRSELGTIKSRTEKFATVEGLQKEFPAFQLWEILSTVERQQLLTEEFKPTTYARTLVLRKFGLTNPETIKKDRQKLRKADK